MAKQRSAWLQAVEFLLNRLHLRLESHTFRHSGASHFCKFINRSAGVALRTARLRLATLMLTSAWKDKRAISPHYFCKFRMQLRHWVYFSVLVWFLLGLFLTTAIVPVLSNQPESDLTVQQLSAPQLVEQGRDLYAKGNFQEAAAVWHQATQTYENQGDKLHQAMALSYLSLAYQRLEQWTDAQTAIQTSLSLLEIQDDIESSKERTQIYAQALNTRGRLELALGQAEAALKTWQLATTTYKQVSDETGVTGSLINQAQAMEVLGLYRRTCQTLLNALKLDNSCDLSDKERFEIVLQTFEKQSNLQIEIIGLRSLGNILQLMGNLDSSQQLLSQSLAVVQQAQFPYEESVTLLSLGKTERAKYNQAKDLHSRTNLPSEKEAAEQVVQQSVNQALEYYQKAAEKATTLSSSQLLVIQAKLHQLSLLIDYYQWRDKLTDKRDNAQTQNLEAEIEFHVKDLLDSKIARLPPSQTSIYAQLNFAQSLIQLKPKDEWTSLAITYAQKALQNARQLQDLRSQSQALGTVGNLYEQTQQWSLAQDVTEQAVILAQAIQASEIAYQWQWQLGRVLNQQGKNQDAIAAYEVAITTLKSVRDDLSAIDSEVRFSFRDSIEPIYRELVTLLLPVGEVNPSQENLQKSLYYIESLQIAELENFLACNLSEQNESVAALTSRISQLAQDDPTAALLYPIVSEQQVATIVKLPGQPLRYHAYSIPQTDVETTIGQLQQYLRDPSRTNDVKKLSNQVYDWLLQPLEEELEIAIDLKDSSIKTLIFVLEGSLRNIPVAVLYDGKREHYLVERYAIAVSSGLQLLNPKPLPKQINALVAGLSEKREFAGQTFAPLKNVPEELQAIESVVPSTTLLNETFTQSNLQNQLNSGSRSVVHLATHGKFSSNPDETFIVLWDSRLNLANLNTLVQSNDPNQTIELLVLSACETAAGDKRAALGLAGVALQAGASSTLATLWQVDDESTAELMIQFYRQLQADPKITKAEALRRVQLNLWKNQDKDWEVPFFWASYVLVGNWL